MLTLSMAEIHSDQIQEEIKTFILSLCKLENKIEASQGDTKLTGAKDLPSFLVLHTFVKEILPMTLKEKHS